MTTTYLLDDVTTFLTASAEPLTFGTNLFAGLLPDNPDSATACFEYSGIEPLYTMGPSTLPAIAQPHLQIVARDISYTAARDSAEATARVLETVVNMALSGTNYLRIARLQDPFFMQRDTVKNRVYFACNFDVMRVPS